MTPNRGPIASCSRDWRGSRPRSLVGTRGRLAESNSRASDAARMPRRVGSLRLGYLKHTGTMSTWRSPAVVSRSGTVLGQRLRSSYTKT